MASSIGTAFRSFWHTMTSYDRHSDFDSPYRSGTHQPLNQRGQGLTSVATASESRADITNPYGEDFGRGSAAHFDGSSTAYGGFDASHSLPNSPAPNGRPYSPGMRSFTAKRSSTVDGFEMQSPSGEIPMQSFQDGLPPAPPVSHTWARIDKWADENYPELYDQLCEGCTSNDINELEHVLDCTLPQDVRESLQVHDGQERGGRPTGIFFSSMLLDCEEIVQEWDNWRKVNHEYLLDSSAHQRPSVPSRTLGGGSQSSGQASSSKQAPSSPTSSTGSNWKQDLLSKQDSVPANAVRKAYAHPAWIPLVRDWGGNNLAVDLAPGPAGHWGQVILFGRDYDTKYVVARSWSHLISIVADDLNSGKWYVDEETHELKLREFKQARVEPAYFDILRWRTDQKYGRRAPRRKPGPPNGAASPTGSMSPYMSPVEPSTEVRGRSMQRLSAKSPVASPGRPGYGKSSPLARVAEEAPLPLAAMANTNGAQHDESLVEVETPRHSDEENKAPRLSALENGEGAAAGGSSPTGSDKAKSPKANGKLPAVLEDGLKTIEI